MYRLSGKILYAFTRPIIRWYIKGSRRSYVLLVKGGDVLLVRNWLGNGAWSLPGGGAHRHESYAQAVVREVHEELGILIDESVLVPINGGMWTSNGFRYAYQCSCVRMNTGVKLRKRFLEITDAVYINMDAARVLKNIPLEIREAIALVQSEQTG